MKTEPECFYDNRYKNIQTRNRCISAPYTCVDIPQKTLTIDAEFLNPKMEEIIEILLNCKTAQPHGIKSRSDIIGGNDGI